MAKLSAQFSNTNTMPDLGYKNELGIMLAEDMRMQVAIRHHIQNWNFTQPISILHESSHILTMIALNRPGAGLSHLPYQNDWEAEVFVFAIESTLNKLQNTEILAHDALCYRLFRNALNDQAANLQNTLNNARKQKGNAEPYSPPDEETYRKFHEGFFPMMRALRERIVLNSLLPAKSFTVTPTERAMLSLNIRDLVSASWQTPYKPDAPINKAQPDHTFPELL